MRQRLTSFRARIRKFADSSRRGWIIEQRYGAGLERLRRSRPEAIELLVEAAHHKHWCIRWRAAALLMDWGEEQHVPQLTSLLDDPSSLVRECTALTIGAIGGSEAVDILRRRLLEGHGNLSCFMMGLAYNDQPAVPVFVEAMQSEQPAVREAGALGLIILVEGPDSTEECRELAREHLDRLEQDPQAQAVLKAARRYLSL